MTYSIVYDALQIKITRFQKPASIINLNELTAAMMIGYHQAGIDPPGLEAGITVEDARQAFLHATENSADINPGLITIIKAYPHEKSTLDETAIETYNFGRTYLKS